MSTCPNCGASLIIKNGEICLLEKPVINSFDQLWQREDPDVAILANLAARDIDALGAGGEAIGALQRFIEWIEKVIKKEDITQIVILYETLKISRLVIGKQLDTMPELVAEIKTISAGLHLILEPAEKHLSPEEYRVLSDFCLEVSRQVTSEERPFYVPRQ